jgi:hypothetical protein
MLARLSERLMGVAGIEQVARSQIGVEAFS